MIKRTTVVLPVIAWVGAMFLYSEYWYIVYLGGAVAFFYYAISTAEREPDWKSLKCTCENCDGFCLENERCELYTGADDNER